jgi:predicted nucleic acid-binding protein
MNADKFGAFNQYFKQVQATLAAGHASEGSHYPTLKALLESFGDAIIAATALQINAPLLTNNVEHYPFPNLKVIRGLEISSQ